MSRPTTRVLALLELLQNRTRSSGAELARQLSVDIRTVRRYITVLEDIGIPVTTESGRYGGYQLVAGFKLPPMMFTDEETLAIALGLRAAGQLGLADAAPALAGVQAKLERVMPEALKRRVRGASESIDIILPRAEAATPGEALMQLSEAAASRRQVEFDYRSQQAQDTRRRLDPYGLVYRHGRWYVCGFCRLREALRTFRLDRLGALRVLDTHFERPASFDSARYLHESLQQSLATAQQHPISLVLHTDLQTASRIVTGIETLLEQHADGLLLHTSTDSLPCFARWLAYLPFRFTVLEPAELGAALRAEAKRLIAGAGSLPD